jgi:UDP-N-acetylglucosamine acyltransferase
MNIHPTALVDPGAKLADDVTIGAYAYVGPNVELGPGCVIDHHANVEKLTTMGAGTRVWPFASVGGDPQDLKYQGGDTRLIIGQNVRIREFATLNRGTEDGGGVTTVGDDCLLMAYSHVAHDCHLGRRVILANSSNLAGHVTMEEFTSLGGLVAVHQFTRIGAYCYVGGQSAVVKDLPPYTLCEGNRAVSHGLNLIGLKRAGFSAETIEALKAAYRIIFRTRTPLRQALEEVKREVPELPEVKRLIEFIEGSQRGVAR